MLEEQAPPLISVVIPTKDRCELIQDAIAGLAAQSLAAQLFEVVVVDNGSADNTIEVLEALAPSLAFSLRVLPNPVADRGPAPARNYGVKNASGSIIAFLDSDCRPHPEWLATAAASFAQAPELQFATGIIDFKPEQLDSIGFFSRKTVVALEEHPTYPTANSFYRKQIFLDHGGFDEQLSFPNIMGQSVEAADTDLAWRIRRAGHRPIFMRDAIVYHEVQTLPPREWLTEPLRLFLLPALIKQHPQLRGELLYANLLFYPRSAIYYGAALLLIVAAVLTPTLLWWLPLMLLLLSALKSGSLSPLAWWRAAKQLLLNTLRNYIMCAALLYGSFMYRTLVL